MAVCGTLGLQSFWGSGEVFYMPCVFSVSKKKKKHINV